MKIFLTGATGFIGSAFCNLALQRGHEIMGLIMPGQPVPAGQKITWVTGTLEETPWKQVAAFAPDVCIHAAWITTPGVYLESPENIRFREASKQFLRKARENGAAYIIGVGTCIEYRITTEPLSEDRTPLEPTTLYSRCKNELRIDLEQQSRSAGAPFAWARVFYPYGPGEHPSRLSTSIFEKLRRGEKISLKTPASIKDYIYIDDLAAALLAVVENKFNGAINLATGVGVTVREMAHILGGLAGRIDLIEEVSPPMHDPFPSVVGDASKLRALGWKPRVSLQEGLLRLSKAVSAAK